MYCLTNLLLFNIPLSYCYTRLNLSIICYLFSGDVCLSFDISYLPLTAFKLFCNVFSTFKILSVILLPIKSPVASAVF